MSRPYNRTPGTIACVKLISGELIIGRVLDATDPYHFVLEKPTMLQLVPRADGKGFSPILLPFMGNEVLIYDRTVMAECKAEAVDPNILKHYIQLVTGLEMATSLPSRKGGV